MGWLKFGHFGVKLKKVLLVTIPLFTYLSIFTPNFYKIRLFLHAPSSGQFRTLNWTAIKGDIEFSKIFRMFPNLLLQN